jgi:HEPN domain-containing protein
MNLNEEQVHRIQFASNLRDYADRDYISARTLYRNNCKDHFLYLAQQSLEKYLKSILLYHGISSKKEGHDLKKLINKCRSEIGNFIVSKEVSNYTKDKIYNYNYIRYPDFPFDANTDDLILLDKSVREIRFYCESPSKSTLKRFTKQKKQKLDKEYLFNSDKKRFLNGHLEKVLDSRLGTTDEERDNLLWQNLYYSDIDILSIPFKTWSKNNHLFSGSPEESLEIYNAIKDFVYLPQELKDHFYFYKHGYFYLYEYLVHCDE